MKERRSGKNTELMTKFYDNICTDRCLMNILSQPVYVKLDDGRMAITGYRNHGIECGECWRYMDERLLQIAIKDKK